jgi:hypothetical protein
MTKDTQILARTLPATFLIEKSGCILAIFFLSVEKVAGMLPTTYFSSVDQIPRE